MPADINRREFATGLAAGLAGANLLTPAPAPGDDTPPETKPQEEQQRQEDHLVAVIAARYPHEQLTDEVLASIRGSVRYHISRGERLSRVPLKNSDEPAFVFAAWRREG